MVRTAISASTNPPISPSTLPATPIAAPSVTSRNINRRRVTPSTRSSASCARRRTTARACVEKTSRPPVNSATSARTFMLTRYDRDRLSLATTPAWGRCTASPAGNSACRRSRKLSTSTPGLRRRSTRVMRPTRSKFVWTPAISMTAKRCSPLAGANPATRSPTTRNAFCSLTLAPASMPSQRDAAGLKKSASDRRRSRRSSGAATRPGCTPAARKASMPMIFSTSLRSAILASTSTAGLAIAISGMRASFG